MVWRREKGKEESEHNQEGSVGIGMRGE